MFSVVDAVLLRALPLPEPERVVALVPQVGAEERGGSPALLAAWGERSSQLRPIAALRTRDATLIASSAPERVTGAAVSGRFFGVLRVAPALGRALGSADDVPDSPRVVVLSHALWTRAFDADTRVVGRPVRLDGALHTVVGVMPPALDAVTGDQQFWTALALDPSQRENYTPYVTLIGRLAPGATTTSAARELDAIVAQLGEPAMVEGAPQRARVLPAAGYIVRDYRQPLVLMLGAVAVVLGIACANVATLVLARSVGRVRELAVRASLGAGLLVRSALALGRVRPGFDVAQVLTARLALPERDYPAPPRAIDAYQAILAATRA